MAAGRTHPVQDRAMMRLSRDDRWKACDDFLFFRHYVCPKYALSSEIAHKTIALLQRPICKFAANSVTEPLQEG